MVRKISPADGMVLKDVRLRALRDAPYAFTETLAQVEHDPDVEWVEWAVEMSADEGDSVAYLAFDGDPTTAIGMAGGYLHRERDDEAVVWGVWVDPSARGTGVARELVEAVISWAGRRDRALVTLCVTETSDPAISLYRALGFEERGPRRPHRHLECASEISMACSLVRG